MSVLELRGPRSFEPEGKLAEVLGLAATHGVRVVENVSRLPDEKRVQTNVVLFEVGAVDVHFQLSWASPTRLGGFCLMLNNGRSLRDKASFISDVLTLLGVDESEQEKAVKRGGCSGAFRW